MTQTQQRYRTFAAHEPRLTVFLKPWWLDAVCGPDGWDAVVCEHNGNLEGIMPFSISRKGPFKLLNMPKLTSAWGPWINYPDGQKYSSRLSYEHQVIGELLQQLPRFDHFNQRLRYDISNGLAYHWKNFSLTTRYTYVINDLTNLEALWDGVNSNIRREIRKAEKSITVSTTEDVGKFYEVNVKTFARQNIKIPYTLDYLRKIDDACNANQSRRIFLSHDAQGNLHSGLYLVWDNNSAYYLMGGSDPGYTSSGAFSLLMWHAIQHAATVTKKFDFEGSMIEPIERFVRSFGATQTPYLQIQKTNSWLMKVAANFMR